MKAKFGAFIVEGRNKIGDQVFSKNHWGAFVRNRIDTPLRQNAYTAIARGNLTTFSQAWATLAESQRIAWNDLAATISRTDAISNVYTLTGQTLFIGLNCNLLNIGSASITDPPVYSLPTDLVNFTCFFNTIAGRFRLTFESNVDDANSKVLVFASNQISPGIFYANRQLRLIGSYDRNFNTELEIQTEYDIKYPGSVPGLKSFLRVYPVDILTGITGIKFTGSCIST